VSEDVLVRSGDAEFWVRVVDAGGPSTIGLGDALSFDGVRKTVEEIGSQLSGAWARVKPDEADAAATTRLRAFRATAARPLGPRALRALDDHLGQLAA
jgi:hypothetical protein